jgi:hypothetical protein
MKSVVKAGKLANGYEADKGIVVHAIEDDNCYAGSTKAAMCGARPRVSWSERTLSVSCSKCLKKLNIIKHEKN